LQFLVLNVLFRSNSDRLGCRSQSSRYWNRSLILF